MNDFAVKNIAVPDRFPDQAYGIDLVFLFQPVHIAFINSTQGSVLILELALGELIEYLFPFISCNKLPDRIDRRMDVLQIGKPAGSEVSGIGFHDIKVMNKFLASGDEFLF